ncbi:MAG TPA: molybdopterin-dependent oxidoreductase [Solirubrobacteraceae bacterium]|nr:molybdopterin-dependent oxidoreductase [Solirubrobacteraceae bacterium]
MRLPGVDPSKPPPGPFRADFWRSPLRGPWLTAVLGLVLLIGLPIVIITGLLSNDAYQPGLSFSNALGRNVNGPLDFYLFGWPTSPTWLYALTQGLHVTIGLALFPVVLAKLWSVIPRLFEWPPVRTPAHALERLSLALLVGGALFEFATGILNIQYWYVFPFFFTQAHYYGAWVFIGAFLVHVTLKFGTMRRSLKTRRELLDVVPEVGVNPSERSLVAVRPAQATMSRRALLGTVGAGALLLGLQGAGQSIGGPFRALALLLPRGRVRPGPLGFPVNKTAIAAGISAADVGANWRVMLVGKRAVSLSREQLLALPQHSYDLPIACVEGWSTTQRWSGVRLGDLASLCGVHGRATLSTRSLDPGTFGRASLGHEQVADDRSLLALRVNGLDLSPDHGYPARVISPAVPGDHCTKWVTMMTFTPVPE